MPFAVMLRGAASLVHSATAMSARAVSKTGRPANRNRKEEIRERLIPTESEETGRRRTRARAFPSPVTVFYPSPSSTFLQNRSPGFILNPRFCPVFTGQQKDGNGTGSCRRARRRPYRRARLTYPLGRRKHGSPSPNFRALLSRTRQNHLSPCTESPAFTVLSHFGTPL